MSRLESQTIEYKTSLDKAIDNDSLESIIDLLKILKDIPMTYELLKSTLIGHSLNNAKKKYPNTNIAQLAKDIMNNWKNKCSKPSEIKQLSQESSNSLSNIADEDGNIKLSNNTSNELETKTTVDIPFDYKSLLKNYSDGRIKIIELISSHLKADCDDKAAKFLSFCIEDAVNSKYDNEADKKEYKDKLKSLSFNLKQNKILREQVINGTIQMNDLVNMTANDLATEETRIARGKIAEASFNERRSDMYELKRSEIQAANGIDPNKGGEFTCKKCKSKKQRTIKCKLEVQMSR